MEKSILYRKVIVLTSVIVLLGSGCQSTGYSQDIDFSDIEVEVRTIPRPELSVDEIYNKTIRSLV